MKKKCASYAGLQTLLSINMSPFAERRQRDCYMLNITERATGKLIKNERVIKTQ